MFNELKIKDSDKKRIIEYIKENELDYKTSDGPIFRFHLISEDDYIFQICEHNDEYVVIKSDKKHSKFEYYYYKNLQQVMEQLAFYDNNLTKIWWHLLDGIRRPSSINIPFIKEGYSEDWLKDFPINKNWQYSETEQYKFLVFEKKTHIKIISPHDKYGEYPPYDLYKLYMEVHPISVKEGDESFFVKILINNEEIMKEYINYRVYRKKGLKEFFKHFFNNKNEYIKIQ